MYKTLVAMVLCPVVLAPSRTTLPGPDPAVVYQMRQQLEELRLDLLNSGLAMDDIILDDIQQENLRAFEDRRQYMSPLKCLTDNIYYEAANEPFEGKVAVAQVVMNRVADDFGGDTVCAVIYFKKINPTTGKKQAAFSWTLGRKWRARHVSRSVYHECQQIAREVLKGELRSDVIGTDVEWYHAQSIHPLWADDHQFVTQIGAHLFYRER